MTEPPKPRPSSEEISKRLAMTAYHYPPQNGEGLKLATLLIKEAIDAERAVVEAAQAEIRSLQDDRTDQEVLISELRAKLEESQKSFKNFHRNLCQRFGYFHDEVDWGRDQASLEEHIAAMLEISEKNDAANIERLYDAEKKLEAAERELAAYREAGK